MMGLLRPAAVALMVLCPLPALAGTTAEAVWQMMQDGIREAGGTLTATASRRGDRLVLTRGQIDMTEGVLLMLPDFTLRQSPSGEVALELPPRFPLVIDPPDSPDSPPKVTLTVSAPDLAATFRDIGPEKVDFAITSGSVAATMEPLEMPPSSTMPDDVFLTLAAADLSLIWKSSLSETAASDVAATMSLGTLHAEMQATIPSESMQGSMVLDMSALSASLDGFLPAGGAARLAEAEEAEAPPVRNLLALLDEGMRLHLTSRQGPVALTFDAPATADGPFYMHLSAQSGDTLLSLDRSGLAYDIGSGPVQMEVRGKTPDIPLDSFGFSATELRETVKLGLPRAGITAPDWVVLYRFAGLTVSDNLWDLADPGRSLPRDPMSLVLDLSGTYTPDPRLLAPGDWNPGPGEVPFTAATVKLAEVLLEGAGIRIAGTGDLAFDFADHTAYIDGTPVPDGRLSFLTTGANGLIEKLSAMGLMSGDDLSAARFGLMFLGRAVPGQTDQLSTEIEFSEGGFSLNGQKIR